MSHLADARLGLKQKFKVFLKEEFIKNNNNNKEKRRKKQTNKEGNN